MTAEKELAEILKMESAISKADERLRFVTQGQNFLRSDRRYIMEMSDWTTGMNTAMEIGVEKGIEKGVEKSKIDVAKNALSMGLPIETIQQITGLSEPEISVLQDM